MSSINPNYEFNSTTINNNIISNHDTTNSPISYHHNDLSHPTPSPSKRKRSRWERNSNNKTCVSPQTSKNKSNKPYVSPNSTSSSPSLSNEYIKDTNPHNNNLTFSKLDLSPASYTDITNEYKSGATEEQMGITLFRNNSIIMRDTSHINNNAMNNNNVDNVKKFINNNNSSCNERILFISPLECTIKQRTTDFGVHEVDLYGNIVRLSNIESPVELSSIHTNSIDIAITRLGELVGREIADKFVLFVSSEQNRLEEWENSNPMPKRPIARDFVFDVKLDKSARGEVHTLIRNYWTSIITDTIDKPEESSVDANHHNISQPHLIIQPDTKSQKLSNKSSLFPKYLRARLSSLTSKSDRDSRDDSLWPRQRSAYLHFTLYKENLTTLDALSSIANQTHTNLKSYGFAGTKDKRGCTTQRVSVWKVTAEKMKRINRHWIEKEVDKRKYDSSERDRYDGCSIGVGNFSYSEAPIRLGDLSGNHFDITLRNLSTSIDSSSLIPLVTAVSINGFINYYGMQRFGSTCVPTNIIGKCLLKGEWMKVVALILLEREGEREDIRSARQYLRDTMDIEGSINKFPYFLRTERTLLSTLHDQGINAFSNAIESIPRQMRLMYVHAFQSYIWNKMATWRLINLPNKVIKGDLVRIKNKENCYNQPSANSTSNETITQHSTSASTNDTIIDSSISDFDSSDVITDPSCVKLVSDEDVESDIYSMNDLILPLPGSTSIYPTHIQSSAYKNILIEEGVDLSTPTHKDYQLKGGYRHLIAVPTNFTYSFFSYSDPFESYMRNDINQLKGYEYVHPREGDKKGLHLSFTLPSSTYATMLIREITRESTTVKQQMEGEKRFKSRDSTQPEITLLG